MSLYVVGSRGRVGVFLLIASSAVLISACGGRQAQNEQLLKERASRSSEAADLLASVQDVASAKAAAPHIKAVLQEIARLDQRLEKYDPADVDSGDEGSIDAHVAMGIQQTQRMMSETLRISKIPELTDALGETWKMLPSVAALQATGMIPK